MGGRVGKIGLEMSLNTISRALGELGNWNAERQAGNRGLAHEVPGGTSQGLRWGHSCDTQAENLDTFK